MNDHIHIIITGAKEKARTILLSRKKLKLGLALSAVLLCAVVVGAIFSTRLFVENSHLSAQVSAMNLKLIESTQENRHYANRIDDLLSMNTSQTASFEAEKEALVNKTLAEFNERNRLIENVMRNLGVKIQKHKGGPYIPPSESLQEELLLRTDKNISILRRTPLGRPISGQISSPFGYREDPINGKKGFHAGVDMKGRHGEKIVATADGTVIQANTNGDHGRYVKISHGNGFTTSFSHLQAFKVKKGDKVKRGQVIGLVGTSGRSTGAHLHYELALNGKAINPATFIQTADLSKKAPVKMIMAAAAKDKKKISPRASTIQ
ncbi:MAG: M23 family metallopeptidase [Desulfoarculaceae bacterium]|nr:M23 family metallopeptidase [Desulfoarculaceae bacterium]